KGRGETRGLAAAGRTGAGPPPQKPNFTREVCATPALAGSKQNTRCGLGGERAMAKGNTPLAPSGVATAAQLMATADQLGIPRSLPTAPVLWSSVQRWNCSKEPTQGCRPPFTPFSPAL